MKIEPMKVDWEANIRCRPNAYPVIEITDEKGGIITKPIAPEELIRILSQSQVIDTWREVPILPEHCFRYADTPNNNQAYKVLLLLPPQNHDTWLFDQRMEKVAFPSLLFGFVVRNGSVQTKRVVALKDDYVTDETPVYEYPYSNVYRDASACWHNLPQISDLRQLGTLPELFFASPDTMELLHSGQNGSGLPYRELLAKYQGRDFPGEILVPRNETVGDFWKRL